MKQTIGNIPNWVKQTTNWWALTSISDEKFTEGIQYLIKKEIIMIPENKKFEDTNELKMISSIRNNLSIWTQNEASDEEFYKNVNWLNVLAS